MRQVLLLGCSVLCAAAVAQGADQTVLGRSLIIKSSGIPTITLKAKESASDDTLVGDPVSGGATLTITANGATPSAQTYALPAPFWTGDAVAGFKYSDPHGENGPVKRAQVKLRASVFQVKAKIDGAL